MKNIYKTFTFVVLVMFFALFTACEFNKTEDSAKNVKPQTEIENPSENTKALLTIKASIDTSGNMAGRKLMTDEDSVELFYKRYVKFVLSGKYKGPGPADTDSQTIKTWNNYEELINDTELELKPGEYELKLEGYYYREKDADGTSYLFIPLTSEQITVELAANESNEISFVLLPFTKNTNGVASGNGMPFNFLISVADYSGLYTDAELNIYDYDNFIRGVQESQCLITTKTGDKFNLYDESTKSSYTEYDILINSLSPGRYWIKGKLKDNDDNERVFCNEQMIIVAGNYIEKTYEVGRYKLNYVLNGGTLDNAYISGETEGTPWGYYTSATKVELPIPVKEGYVFKGWFMDAAFTPNNSFAYKEDENGNETSVIFNKYGTLTGDKTLYAQWAEAVTVNYYVYGLPKYTDSPFKVTEIIDKTTNLNNISLLDFEEYESDNEMYRYDFSGWYTEAVTTLEYEGEAVTSLSSFGDASVINLYGFVGEQFGNNYQANNYKLGSNARAIPTFFGDFNIQQGDTLFFTTTIITNKELQLKCDCNGFVNDSNLHAKSNGQETVTVPANTITEIDWTVDITLNRNSNSLYWLLYKDNTSDDDEYLSDVVVNCVYSNVQKTKGTSDFVLWNGFGEKKTVTLDLKNEAYSDSYYDEDNLTYGLPYYASYWYIDQNAGTSTSITVYDKLDIRQSSDESSASNYYENPGFTFIDWYDDPELTIPSQNIKVSEANNGGKPLPSKTYYAKWGIYATPAAEGSYYQTQDNYKNQQYFVAHIPYRKIVETDVDYDHYFELKQGKRYSIELKGKSNFEYRTNQSAVNDFKIRLTNADGTEEYATSYCGSRCSFYTDTLNEYPASWSLTISQSDDSFVELDELYIDILFPSKYAYDYTIPSSIQDLIPDGTTELILSDWEFTFEEYPVYFSNSVMLYETLRGDPDDSSDDSLIIAATDEVPYASEAAYKVQSTTDYSKIDSVIDKNNILYVLDYDSNGNFFVVQNGSVLFSQSSLSSIGVTDKVVITDLYVGYEANYLYAAGDDGHGATDFISYNLDDNTIAYGKFTYRFEKDSPYYEMTDFAVLSDDWGGRIFASYVPRNINITELKGFDKRYIAAADFTVSDNKIDFSPYLVTKFEQTNPKTGVTISSDAYSIVSYADLFGETGNSFSPDIKINDMQIVDDDSYGNYYLYVLFGNYNFKKEVRQIGEADEVTSNCFESYGFISRIDVSATAPRIDVSATAPGLGPVSSAGLKWDENFGYGTNTKMFGLYKDALDMTEENNFIGDESDGYIFYKSMDLTTDTIASALTDYLVNPQKFLAIEPKKLYIADDGSFVFSNEAYEMNRIVTVDLENLSYGFNSSAEYVPVQFNNKIDMEVGSGYSGNYQP